MDLPNENWEVDEIKTIRTILNFYHNSLEELKKADRSQYLTREEFCQVTVPLIHCLKRITTQNERLLNCVEQLSAGVIRLTGEVVSLKDKIDQGTL